jgi:hypothetical protein
MYCRNPTHVPSGQPRPTTAATTAAVPLRAYFGSAMAATSHCSIESAGSRHSGRSPLISIAAFIVALAGGGSAAALGLADSTLAVYWACLQHDVGVLYNVKLNSSAPRHCRRDDKLIS